MKNDKLFSRTCVILNSGGAQPGIHLSPRGEHQPKYSPFLETNQCHYTSTRLDSTGTWARTVLSER